MNDMVAPPKNFTFATDLGETRKVFDGRYSARVDRDLDDFDQVFDLAVEIGKAHDRRVMAMTIAESRALARFAVAAGVIASQAAELVAMSDAGAPRDALIERLRALADVARPHVRGST